MSIGKKEINLKETEFKTAQQYAENTTGVWMNMLGGVRFDPVDNKYKLAPIKYSDCSLEGETIKFGNGVELQVLYSCLAKDYANKKEVYNEWWENAKKIVQKYKEQMQVKEYVESNDIDLKKLREQGSLDDEIGE